MAAGDGLISMKPTSIAHSGTSATINADGGVDFTAVTELSLNGVFTGDYDNYLIVLDGTASGSTGLQFRYRVSGTDNSTASSYVSQALGANGTTISKGRDTESFGYLSNQASTQAAGYQAHVYGPYLAQPTAARSVTVYGFGDARLMDYAWTHNQSTSYDGFTLYTAGVTLTGTIHVFGYEE